MEKDQIPLSLRAREYIKKGCLVKRVYKRYCKPTHPEGKGMQFIALTEGNKGDEITLRAL